MKETIIGECQFTLNDLIESKQREFTITNPKKGKKAGKIRLNEFALREKPTFLDYIRGGV